MLGYWNPEAFTTWDTLFRDRFVDFKGKVFPVLCSFDDNPLVNGKNDTADGSNVRILNAMSEWLNFRPYYEKHNNGKHFHVYSNLHTSASFAPCAIYCSFFNAVVIEVAVKSKNSSSDSSGGSEDG